jgi:hypothetical protein
MSNTTKQTSSREIQPAICPAIDIERVIEVRREVTIDAVKERLGNDSALG